MRHRLILLAVAALTASLLIPSAPAAANDEASRAQICAQENIVKNNRSPTDQSVVDTFGQCPWFAAWAQSLAASQTSSQRPEALLPMYRWNVNVIKTFHGEGLFDAISNFPSLLTQGIMSLLFGVSAMLWFLLRSLMDLAVMMSDGIFRLLASPANAVFADIGRTVEGFLTVAFAVVLFSLARAFFGNKKMAAALRNVVILAIFGGIFWGMSATTQRVVDSGGDPLSVGTAAWAGSVVVGLGDHVTAPISQRLAGADDLEFEGVSDAFPGRQATNASCTQYASILHADASSGGVSGILGMLSSLWENTYFRSFTRAQLGPSLSADLPGWSICHFADDQNGVSRADRFSYVSRMYPAGAVAESSPFFGNHDFYGDQLAEAVTAAAACRYVDGEWDHLPMYNDVIFDNDCKQLFQGSASSINKAVDNGRGGGDQFALYGVYDGDSNVLKLTDPGEEDALSLARALSTGGSSVLSIVGAFVAMFSSLGIFVALGMMSLALVFSGALALLAVGFLFPVLLVLLAVQSKKAKGVARLAGSLLLVNVFVQLIMFTVLALSSLIQAAWIGLFAEISSGGVPVLTDVVFGASPLLALYLVHRLLKMAGFGGLLSASGVATMPLAMAARMSGVKSLSDLSRVSDDGRTGFNRLAERSRSKTLRKLSDKDKEHRLDSEIYKRIEGHEGDTKGMRGKLARFTAGSESRRKWEAERKNRDEIQRAARVAREYPGMKEPTNIMEARQVLADVQELQAKDKAKDLYNDYQKASADGSLQRMKQGTEEERARAAVLERYGRLGAGYIPDRQDLMRVLDDHGLVRGASADPGRRMDDISRIAGAPDVAMLYDDPSGVGTSARLTDYSGIPTDAIDAVPGFAAGRADSEHMVNAAAIPTDPKNNLERLNSSFDSSYRIEQLSAIEARGVSSLTELSLSEQQNLNRSAEASATISMLSAGCMNVTGGHARELNGSSRHDILSRVSQASGTPVSQLSCTEYGLVLRRPDPSIDAGADNLVAMAAALESLHASDPAQASNAASAVLNYVPERIRVIADPSERATASEAWIISRGLANIDDMTTVDISAKYGIDPASPLEGLERLRADLDRIDQAPGAMDREMVLLEALTAKRERYNDASTRAPSFSAGQLQFFEQVVQSSQGVLDGKGLDMASLQTASIRAGHALREVSTADPSSRASALASLAERVEEVVTKRAQVGAVKVSMGAICADGLRSEEYVQQLQEQERAELATLSSSVAKIQEAVREKLVKAPKSKKHEMELQALTADLLEEASRVISSLDSIDLETADKAAVELVSRFGPNKNSFPSGKGNSRPTSPWLVDSSKPVKEATAPRWK